MIAISARQLLQDSNTDTNDFYRTGGDGMKVRLQKPCLAQVLLCNTKRYTIHVNLFTFTCFPWTSLHWQAHELVASTCSS